MPEDDAAYLITPTLARFGQGFPLAKIELAFDSSPALLRLLDTGKLDLALVTREPQPPFAVLRRERIVWIASPEHLAWTRNPLPVALFEARDLARRFAVEALQAADRRYRVVSTTHCLLGLITVAQAGLAVVGLIESCVPPPASSCSAKPQASPRCPPSTSVFCPRPATCRSSPSTCATT